MGSSRRVLRLAAVTYLGLAKQVVLLAKYASSQLVRLGTLLSAIDRIASNTAGCGVGIRIRIAVIRSLIDLLE